MDLDRIRNQSRRPREIPPVWTHVPLLRNCPLVRSQRPRKRHPWSLRIVECTTIKPSLKNKHYQKGPRNTSHPIALPNPVRRFYETYNLRRIKKKKKPLLNEFFCNVPPSPSPLLLFFSLTFLFPSLLLLFFPLPSFSLSCFRNQWSKPNKGTGSTTTS